MGFEIFHNKKVYVYETINPLMLVKKIYRDIDEQLYYIYFINDKVSHAEIIHESGESQVIHIDELIMLCHRHSLIRMPYITDQIIFDLESNNIEYFEKMKRVLNVKYITISTLDNKYSFTI